MRKRTFFEETYALETSVYKVKGTRAGKSIRVKNDRMKSEVASVAAFIQLTLRRVSPLTRVWIAATEKNFQKTTVLRTLTLKIILSCFFCKLLDNYAK